MRVIALGSGMPMPRRKQAAASFLIELGNGDKFIFDMGTGSMERLYALGIPLDFIDKVFLTHLHADHMGDLAGFYIYGPQNNRSVPLRVWGPGGEGLRYCNIRLSFFNQGYSAVLCILLGSFRYPFQHHLINQLGIERINFKRPGTNRYQR